MASLGTAASLTLLLWAPALRADDDPAERLRWLQANATAVRGLEPADDDFTDLAPLVDRIGDARVVMLGEASHYDGSTFLAKTRLIRFLHQVMGFSVLAWESGLYDCRKFDAALRSSRPLSEVANQGVFGIWTKTAEVRRLLEYARRTLATPRPLEMAGIDCQWSAKATVASFPADVFAFFDRVDSSLLSPADRKLFESTVQWLASVNYQEETEDCRRFVALLQRLLEAASQPRFRVAHGEREVRFMSRVLRNAIELERLNTKTETIQGKHVAGLNIRNKAMADNLVWLAREYYGDRKLIVWAASSHLSRNAADVPLPGDPNKIGWVKQIVEAGDGIVAEMGSEVYSIGFSAYMYEGNPAPEGSLEELAHRSGRPYLFIDLKGQPPGHWLRGPVQSNVLGLPATTDWSRVFDGIFVIDNMTPSTFIEPR